MQEQLSGDALFAQILMHRQVDPRLQLVIEGSDELAALTGHLDESNVLLLMGGGKPALLRAGRLLESHSVDFALVAVDKDLDDLTGRSSGYPATVVATDGYDLATDILVARGDLLRRAAVSHGGRACVTAIEERRGLDLLSAVVDVVSRVVVIRLVNEEHSLGMNLRDFPFADVLDKDLGLIPIVEVLARVDRRTGTTIDIERTEGLIRTCASRVAADLGYCGGHDVFGATAAILRLSGRRGIGAAQIAASIYTAVGCELIKALSLYRAVEAWAARHHVTAFSC
jgi:hypothetical protein